MSDNPHRRGRRAVRWLGAVCIGDTALVLAIGGGINLGTLMPGLVGVGLIALSVLRASLGVRAPGGRVSKGIRMVAIAFGIWLASVIVVEGLILCSAFPGAPAEADWLFVLGAGLRDGRPTLTLRKRLLRAADYLNRHPGTRAMVSGGLDRGERVTEAEAMQAFLIEQGIAESRIIKEERATSTFENLAYSAKLAREAAGVDVGRVAVISSDFHLFRIKFLARRLGLDVIPIRAPSPWYLLPNSCSREYFAVWKSFLLDR